MPCIRDNSTVEAIAQAFVSNGRDKGKALRTAGYSRHYSEHNGLKLFDNVRLIQAIARIDAAAQAETGWDVETALKELRQRLAYVKTKAESGDTTATTVQLQILREINDIMGLHKQRVVQEQAEERALSQRERELADRLAKLALTG